MAAATGHPDTPVASLLGATAIAAAAAAARLLYMKRRVNYARRVQGARRQLAPKADFAALAFCRGVMTCARLGASHENRVFHT